MAALAENKKPVRPVIKAASHSVQQHKKQSSQTSQQTLLSLLVLLSFLHLSITPSGLLISVAQNYANSGTGPQTKVIRGYDGYGQSIPSSITNWTLTDSYNNETLHDHYGLINLPLYASWKHS